MKLAFSSLGCPDFSFEQAIRAAVDYGYQAIGIRMLEGTTDLLGLPDFATGRAKSRARLKDSGIELLSVSTGVRFTSPIESERNKQLEEAKRYIDLAAELSSPFVRIFGGPITPEMDRDFTLANIEAGFREAAQHAIEQGVTVLLETHDSFSTGKSAREMLDRIDHPGAGLIWDILHSFRFGDTFAETVSTTRKYIRHVHIKDSSKFDQNGFDLKLCGEGRLPIAEALRLLDSIGYDGYYEFEWERGWHRELVTEDIAFPHFIRYIAELRKSLDA